MYYLRTITVNNKYINIQNFDLLNDKEFCFSLIDLNSIFSTLPQSEYTSRVVSTPRVRYIGACVYCCLWTIRCFNVVQQEKRCHFQSAIKLPKKKLKFSKISKFQNFTKTFFFSEISYSFKIFQKNSKFKKIHTKDWEL